MSYSMGHLEIVKHEDLVYDWLSLFSGLDCWTETLNWTDACLFKFLK